MLATWLARGETLYVYVIAIRFMKRTDNLAASYDTDLLKHIQDAGCVQSHEPGDGVLTNADVEDDEDEDDDGDEDEQYDYDVEHLNEYYWHGRRRT